MYNVGATLGRCWFNAGLMLVQYWFNVGLINIVGLILVHRLQRWTNIMNIEPTLYQHHFFTGFIVIISYCMTGLTMVTSPKMC